MMRVRLIITPPLFSCSNNPTNSSKLQTFSA
jgi:hypothetical protein